MIHGIEIVVLIPAAAALLCGLSRDERALSWITILAAGACLAAAAWTFWPVFSAGTVLEYGMWYVDGLSALFLILTAAVTFAVALYSHGYLRFERAAGGLTLRAEKTYYISLNLFVTAMLCVFLVSSLGMIWIIIEATTLVSTFLVGFYRDEGSTEASWKYLIICSVGITLALLGISLLYASAIGVIGSVSSALDWPVLMSVAADLDPVLLKTAMALVIIGFGTKAGFAPMHTWLPDAHSQAPTPVSALLSAALLNCALYSIIRFYMISEIAIPGFASTLLLIFGIASVFVASMFILNAKELKRMLAYSSVEHIGLIAVGLGIGTTWSVFAALFMVVAHSLTKPILFFCAGNIIQGYGTKEMSAVRGLGKTMPYTAAMLTVGSLAIVGMPPFAVFTGEIALLYSAVSAGMWWLTILLVVLLIIIFAGFTGRVFPMLSGSAEAEVTEPEGPIRAAPLAILAVAMTAMGLFAPESVADGFRMIAESMIGGLA